MSLRVVVVVVDCLCLYLTVSHSHSCRDSCGLIGTIASSLYLVDALLYFCDWLVLNRTGFESVYGQHQLWTTSITQRIDYYLFGNIFFILGIIADFVTGHYGGLDDADYVALTEYAWYQGSMIFWIIYAIFEIFRCTRDRLNRDLLKAPARFYLFPWGQKKHVPDAQHVGFAWDLCGSYLFLIASCLYLLSAYLWYFGYAVPGSEERCAACYMLEITAATVFIVNGFTAMANQAVNRYLKRGEIFYHDSDLETTRDFEPTKDTEACASLDAEAGASIERPQSAPVGAAVHDETTALLAPPPSRSAPPRIK